MTWKVVMERTVPKDDELRNVPITVTDTDVPNIAAIYSTRINVSGGQLNCYINRILVASYEVGLPDMDVSFQRGSDA